MCVTIIISIATVLVRFGYVQHIGVGMVHSTCSPGALKLLNVMKIIAAATARYSRPACNHKGGDNSG